MDKDLGIPIPVRFNPFKHHRNYILEILESASSEMIASLLDPVCNNYIDIYTGTMSPEDIYKAVIDILKSNHVFESDDFNRWVNLKNGYQEIKLEDQSQWVVRISNEKERYIHLHPSRTGPLSMRFKGSTLKTIYLLKIHLPETKKTISLEDVNRVRLHIGLSPVKKLDKGKGILSCFEKFFRPS